MPCLVIRCRESHPIPQLSQEDLDAISEIEESVKERVKVFSDMEAFLPKKNGWASPPTPTQAAGAAVRHSGICNVQVITDLHLLLSRLYLSLVLGNVNVTLLNKQSK